MKLRLALIAGSLSLSTAGQAAQVRGTLTTLLAGREDPRNGEGVLEIPLYELVSIEAYELGIPFTDSARVVLQGWGRLQLADDELKDHDADLGLLYLEARKGPVRLKLGRQHLTYGVGRMELIDGLDARYDVGWGVSAQGFFGFTVHPQLRHRTDNFQGGGRMAFNLSQVGQTGEVGISYLQRRQRGELHRHELGLDAFALVGPVRLVGVAVLNPTERVLVEARLAGTWRPIEELSLTVDAEHVQPELFLPLHSIFSVFSNASHDAFGAEASWSPNPYWTVDFVGHALLLDVDYLGYRATLRGTTYREPTHRSLIGAEIRRLDEADNGYLRGRAFTALQILEELRVSADVFAYYFDAEVNGVHHSLLGQASVIWEIIPSMRLAATIAGGTTPWAKAQLEGMLRFAWGWEIDLAEEVAP